MYFRELSKSMKTNGEEVGKYVAKAFPFTMAGLSINLICCAHPPLRCSGPSHLAAGPGNTLLSEYQNKPIYVRWNTGCVATGKPDELVMALY